MGRLLSFWLSHRDEAAVLLAQHVMLVAAAVSAATAIGVPLGIFASRRPRIAAPLVGFANVVQTIPSLAMFGFLLPVPFVGGLGGRAAVFVLILYGLLPILRTTITGLRGVDPSIVEAATALGMTPRELLWRIEIPLALPSVVAGIRVAAVLAVGTATIAAAIGAGGLGEYIYRGLSMVDSTVILAGAIPAALLAVAVDGALLLIERALSPRRRSLRRVAAIGLVVAAIGGVATSRAFTVGPKALIAVGSKNFTEQVLLGELVAQTIERRTNLGVRRRLNLGGTLICDRALLAGDIDVYVEYTGTALTAIFHEPIARDPTTVYGRVRDLYAGSGRALFPPLGFDNTFAILVRGSDARALRLRTIEDLARVAPHWRAGFGFEFLERPDGYRGMAALYGLQFREPPHAMDLALTYRALASAQVDVIAGDATAGLIKGLDLYRLDDNRHYFPPYEAAAVARAATLLRHPEVRSALEWLDGRVSADDMRAMNYAVDAEHRDAATVVREFLDPIQSPQ
jgi:osmoprotectant transport system permease protein